MNHLNSILLEGNLLSDPKVVVTAPLGETWGSMVKFDLANHRVYRSDQGETKDDVLMMGCIAFGDLAEKIMPILKCGMRTRVLGRLRCSKWTAKDGSERKSYEIVCQHIEFKRKKRGNKDEEEFSLSDEEKTADKVSESVFFYQYD